MNFKDVKIKNKLIIGFILILLLTGFIGYVSYVFTSNVYNNSSEIFTLTAILTILGSIASGFIIIPLLTKSLVEPIDKIKTEIRMLEETGDLKIRTTIVGKDEIGEMAMVFNDMLDNTTGPLQELAKKSEIIASGDLTIDVELNSINSKGDIAILTESFKTMTQTLKEFVSNVSRNSEISASSAEELSASSEEINASTEQVTSTIQEMARGGQNLSKLASETKKIVDEVGMAAKLVAQNSQKAAEGSLDAGKASDMGMESGRKAGDVMGQILQSTDATAKRIVELDDKSSEIGKVIDVINEISEQTNLLALNAAIEAARAGDAGRGFAVVADEVRKLAEETQKATVSIADMIKSIQTGTKLSVEDMKQSKKIVTEGTLVIEEALASLKRIADISKDVGDKIQEVSSAAQQASAGVEKVQRSMQEVASVAEESAAASEEVSASMQETSSSMSQVSSAAQKLSKGADELRGYVSKFKIGDSQTNLAVDMAISDHKGWCKRLDEMIAGKIKIANDSIKDPRDCRFGKWYYSEGMRNYSKNSAFKKIEWIHNRLHQVGNEAVRLFNSGKKDESARKVVEAYNLSKDIVSLFEELENTA